MSVYVSFKISFKHVLYLCVTLLPSQATHTPILHSIATTTLDRLYLGQDPYTLYNTDSRPLTYF